MPDPQVVGYKLHYGTASRTYTRVVSVDTTASAAVTGLVRGQTYYFAVTSVNASGTESAYSDEISFAVPSVPVTPAPPPGSAPLRYSGLFYEPDQVRQNHAGAFVLSATAAGRYSGYLQIGATRLPFHGQFDGQGQATNLLTGPGGRPLSVQFQRIGAAPADQLLGSITSDTWQADLSADRAGFAGGSHPAPFQGAYTLVAPSQAQLDPTLPAGHSFGLVNVAASGGIRLAASLADGTKFSLNSVLSSQGRWAVYVPLYAGQGSWLGWLDFTNRPTDDFNGAVSWIKPANPSALCYPGGFTNQCTALGSAYSRALGFPGQAPSLTPTTLNFAGGSLVADFTSQVTVNAAGRVNNRSQNPVWMTWYPATGGFFGFVRDPVTGYWYPFSGAVFQKTQTGYGLLLNDGQSSRVVLSP